MGLLYEHKLDLDQRYMKMALREAVRGVGTTSPNPRVGAVLVNEGVILAKGHHRAFGAPHAEIEALQELAPSDTAGKTLYVTLEPCCHHGKTPPCTQAIIRSGIKRVVYALRDPNPAVNGRGLKELQNAGINVSGPICEAEARELNRGYLKFRNTGKPWVTLKFAQSLDGRLATRSGNSQWISGSESLKLAHRLRAEHDAVLIGVNTALMDNPKLTVRLVKGRHPRPVILDSELRISPQAELFKVAKRPVWIATRPYPPVKQAEQLQNAGAEFIWLPHTSDDKLDLQELLNELGRRGILYLLVEGGSKVIGSFIRQGLFDEIVVVTAPLLIGGDGLPSVTALGIDRIHAALRLNVHQLRAYGSDLAWQLRPQKACSQD